MCAKHGLNSADLLLFCFLQLNYCHLVFSLPFHNFLVVENMFCIDRRSMMYLNVLVLQWTIACLLVVFNCLFIILFWIFSTSDFWSLKLWCKWYVSWQGTTCIKMRNMFSNVTLYFWLVLLVQSQTKTMILHYKIGIW